MNLSEFKITRAVARTESHIPLISAVVIISLNLFLTVRFLMGTLATLYLQQSKRVRLPVASDARPIAPQNTLKVVIKADEVAYVNDQPRSDAVLLDEIRQRQPDRVLLSVDRRVRYPRLKSLMLKLGAAGVGKVTFKVVDDSELPRNEPSTPATHSPSP